MRILIGIFISMVLSPVCVWAAAVQDQSFAVPEEYSYTQEDVDEVTGELIYSFPLEDVDRFVEEMLSEEDLSFSDMVKQLVSGEIALDLELLVRILGEIFVNEFLFQKEIILQILLLVIVSALLLNLSHLFEDGQMNKVAFYMVYLLVFVLLMKSFRGLLGQVESVISGASSFMKILTPAYFLAITASNGAVTAAGYYQMILWTITLVNWILLKVAIPGVQMYVVLGMVNNLTQEDYLSKMAELIKTVILWLVKSMTAVVVGLQVLQNMVSPALDMVKRGMIGKTLSAIPGIGNVLDSVTEMAVGCAVLVRNCMGAVALIVLVVFGLGPVIQIGFTALLYKFVAAVSQPVTEKQFVRSVSVVADGCGLLLRILITAEVLFLLSIAIVAAGGAS